MSWSLLLLGCAVTRQPTTDFAPAAAQDRDTVDWAAVLDAPSPITVEHIAFGTAQASPSGLINLKHPDAASVSTEPLDIVVLAHQVTHPEHGTVLIDSGVTAKEDGSLVLRGLAGRVVDFTVLETTADRVPDVGAVFLTHMHLDHILGLPDLPAGTPVRTGPGEADARRGGNGLLRRNVNLLLDGIDLQEIDFSAGDAADVFGDGSLWAIHVPGHTPGSVAYLVNAETGPVLLTGDASHTLWGWDNSVEPGRFSQDIPASAAQLDWLRALAAAHPQLSVVVGHELPVIPGVAPEPAAEMVHRFDDVAHWASVFDAPERDVWQRPAALVAAMGLSPGNVVADIGAGTGYFMPHLAEAVGPEGTVYAVDVEASLVNHMMRRAQSEGLPQVQPVLGALDDPGLPAGGVDQILLVNTYHHIQDRADYFSRLQDALRPGGTLVVVDFTMDSERGPPPAHRLSAAQVVDELVAVGWRDDGALELLPDQYVLRFRL
jgi:glyoxylase-like metal-dependent hydrolase (beta-lactamase superfamily II)/precorrin-6B methylase 2